MRDRRARDSTLSDQFDHRRDDASALDLSYLLVTETIAAWTEPLKPSILGALFSSGETSLLIPRSGSGLPLGAKRGERARGAPAPLFLLGFALALGFFAFGQLVTPIFVDCLICSPFCAVNIVGIASFDLHRFPLAASAEFGPCGRFSSKLATGWSGTVRNVELVIPALLMNVSPCR